MTVFVLTTEDGGDNELFCGCVSSLENINHPEWYNIYRVEVDSAFDCERVPSVPSQAFVTCELQSPTPP